MEEDKNVFNEISETEFEDESPEEKQLAEEIEVTPDSFAGYKWIKNPEVGASVELTIKKIVQKPGKTIKNKETQVEFQTGLLNKKTHERTETIIETADNERFNITSWGLFFNLFGKDSPTMKKSQEKGSFEGIKVKITHNLNGKDAQTKAEDLVKLRGFDNIEEAEAHKKAVAKAIKDGTIYSVEILE